MGAARPGHRDPAFERRFLHIHGSATRPEGLIVSKSDYDDRYINETRAVNYLQILLTVHRVVFIGFSLIRISRNYMAISCLWAYRSHPAQLAV